MLKITSFYVDNLSEIPDKFKEKTEQNFEIISRIIIDHSRDCYYVQVIY